MILTKTRNGQQVELYSFALTDMARWGFNGLRGTASTMVGERDAKGLPALQRAVRLRAEAIAVLELACWKGSGPIKTRVDTVWQARLFRNGPQVNATNSTQTKFDFWETVETSLCWRGNAYIWLNTDSGRVTDWWALHPDQVTARFEHGRVVYDVQVADGYVDPVGKGPGMYKSLGTDVILHLRGHGEGGTLEAPSPIQVFREKLAGPVGRMRHEGRMWRRGVTGQVGIEFPQGVSKDQADQWRESYRSNYEGTEGETTIVVGGGATLKPIGMSPMDANFVTMEHLTVEDAARIMSVPANLLGIQVQMKGTANLEQDLAMWLRFGLGPELKRIEDGLYACPVLFGGSQTYPAFDTTEFVRGDLLTESTILVADVQSGILTPDEARAAKGYEPHPDGLGAIPQITPVGGAPNPEPPPVLTPGGKRDDNQGDEIP